jgi:hypothetical protein
LRGPGGGLLRMRLSDVAAAHSVLILRSPPKAGVSKDGRDETAFNARRTPVLSRPISLPIC